MDRGEGREGMSSLCWFPVCKKKKKGNCQEFVGKSCDKVMTTLSFPQKIC